MCEINILPEVSKGNPEDANYKLIAMLAIYLILKWLFNVNLHIYTKEIQIPLNNNRSIQLTNLKTIVQKFVLFYCALVRAYTKIRNFPGINIHNFYTNGARVRHLHPLIPYYGSVFIFK